MVARFLMALIGRLLGCLVLLINFLVARVCVFPGLNEYFYRRTQIPNLVSLPLSRENSCRLPIVFRWLQHVLRSQWPTANVHNAGMLLQTEASLCEVQERT